MQQQNQKPLLSVAVPVHNHGAFIAKTLESIIMQKTNFNFEIVIGDDCSTDNTQEVLQTIKSKYPQKIKLLLAEKNHGVFKNAHNIYKNCQGSYIATLEGDDYWTYEYKLQKQVDFLEHHEDFKGCFHDAAIISELPSGENSKEYSMRFHQHWKSYSQFNTYKPDFYAWDALQRKIVPTASLVFRNTALLGFFEYYAGFHLSISWAIHLWLLKDSKFRYFNVVWSQYNDHPDGFSKKYSLIDFKINNIKILELLLNDNYYQHLEKDVYKALVQEYFHLLSLPDINKISPKEFTGHCKSYQKYAKLLMKHESYYFTNNYNQKN